MTRKQYPPREFLRKCLEYNPISGLLTWKERPREHFSTDLAWVSFNRRLAGKEAFCVNNTTGYKVGCVTYLGRRYAITAHTAAWLIHCNEELPTIIDHKNSDKLNNSWENLRAATHADNNRNCRPKGLGMKGVTKCRDKYQAHIMVNYKRIYIGIFDSEEEAHLAYVKAANEYFGEFARFN